jgi:hypothetical protein
MVFLMALALFAMGALVCAVPVKATPRSEGSASADRERVLGLLERGAITGDEAAELLSALGERQPEAGNSVMGQRLRWIGVVLVVLGFYLPWAKIDLGQEMSQMQSGMVQQMQQMQSGMPMMATGPNGMNFSTPQMLGGPVVEVHAADLSHGAGWVILGLAVVAGVLPLIRGFRRLPIETRGTTLYSLVGVGLLMSLYVAVQGFQYVQVGLVLDLAGYAMMLVAVGREYRQPWRPA